MIYFFVFLILFLVLVVFLGAKADYDAAQEYKCPIDEPAKPRQGKE